MNNTKEILTKYKTIALVGASKNLSKTSSVVMRFLQKKGFKVYPVNPNIKGEKIMGETVFGKVSEIGDLVDIVNVFRPSNEVKEIAEEAIKVNAKVLWLQLDIKNIEAKKIVEAKSILYVDNKCTKLEYEKYFDK
ncbi:CoA-binding protein [Candidatus Pelagibacter sp.]|nr:CoA-binding protein [Candidatus Pelagibacter sp.]|tara:strand:- start:2426 stop:2830 length:405 start_codon:yes stop_codon:yes gene_type:complete